MPNRGSFSQENPNIIIFEGMHTATKYDNVVALKLDDSIPDYISLGFPNGSEFLEVFNNFILKLRQSGILTKINEKWAPISNAKEVANTVAPGTFLGFENLSFPFILLTLGIILGVVIALIEKLSPEK